MNIFEKRIPSLSGYYRLSGKMRFVNCIILSYMSPEEKVMNRETLKAGTGIQTGTGRR